MNEQYDEATGADWKAINKANFNLAERLFQEGLSVAYDEEGDTLLVTVGIGKQYEALTEEVIDNIFVRILPDSLLVIGFIVLNFATDLLTNNKLARKALGDWFRELRAQGGTANVEGSKTKRIESLFEVVIPR